MVVKEREKFFFVLFTFTISSKPVQNIDVKSNLLKHIFSNLYNVPFFTRNHYVFRNEIEFRCR